MSSLGAQPTQSATLNVPRWGAWRAHVLLATGDAPAAGQTTLTVAGLSLLGTVTDTGLDAPGLRSATVVGAPGWEKLVTAPISFFSDAGVRLSTVLAALSAAAGEPIEQPGDVVMPRFALPAARQGSPVRYRDALAALYRAGHVAAWRVDADGVTRFGDRLAAPVTGRATILWRNAAVGYGLYGIDEARQFLPGNLLNGAPIRRLKVHEAARKLEAEVWQ